MTRLTLLLSAVVLGFSSHADADALDGLLLAQAEPATQQQQPPPTPQQRIAMLQQWLKASQAQLRAYQWIETTAISMKGEEKSRKQNTCYYGVDGVLQKVAVAGSAAADSGSGRGPGARLKARKQEEVTDYMQQAAALIHSYVPPDPERIQQAVNAGKVSANMVEVGRRVQIVFRDYLKPGDQMSIDIELPTNRLLGMGVSSYLADQSDAVQLTVTMGVLPDGTIYTARSDLQAPAEKVGVVIENTGHRRM